MTGKPSPALPSAPSEHGETCSCTRCTGFVAGEPGPALRHGAYSVIRNTQRALQIRELIAPLVPLGSDADAAMIDVASLALAQAERAAIVLSVEQARDAARVQTGEAPSDRGTRLSADARGWLTSAMRALDALGMTPSSRARLAGDVAAAQRDATAAELRRRYLHDAEAAA